jgi:hypothetical protein
MNSIGLNSAQTTQPYAETARVRARIGGFAPGSLAFRTSRKESLRLFMCLSDHCI